jgi:hypothetical protein
LLLVSCIALNVPVALVTYIAYSINPGSYFFNENLPYVYGVGSAFLLAWAVFLIARLTAPTYRMMPAIMLREVLKSGGSHVGHECLGSRFLQWQERHAS